jgi:hypothetical protein
MFFSAAYTDYRIIPRVAQHGKPQEFNMDLTIRVTLDLDWFHAGRAKANQVITHALNHFAGGRRMFRHTPVHVQWHLAWGQPNHDLRRTLQIAFVPKDVLLKGDAGGLFVLKLDGDDYKVGRVLLPSEGLAKSRQIQVGSVGDGFRRVVAHEFGHTQGLPDDPTDSSTVMYFRELRPDQMRRISQRWSDQELRDALQHLFARPSELPSWLNS